MKRVTIVAVLAFASVPVMAEPCLACSCVAYPESERKRQERLARHADVVFTGKVYLVRGDYGSDDGHIKAFFFVEKRYKGIHRFRVAVRTHSSGAMCGYYFREGARYTVLAGEGRENRLHTGLCSGNKRGHINPERWGL